MVNMAETTTIQYLNVPDKVKVKRRGSLPASKLRKILAIKSLHDQGLRHNKSQSDLECLQFSTVLGTPAKKNEGKDLSIPFLNLSRNQSKSSSHLADDIYSNGRNLTSSSPIITLTVPSPGNKMKKASTTSQLPVTPDVSVTTTAATPGQPDNIDSRVSRAAASMRQRDYSPLTARRSLGGENSAAVDSVGKLKMVQTTEGALNYSSTSPADFQTYLLEQDENGESNGGEGGSGSDKTEDCPDGILESDPQRKAAIRQLHDKIEKTMQQIKNEQKTKEENVNEYLRISTTDDKAQAARMKTLFEKRNTKSTQNIRHLQLKLENYKKRLGEVETHGVTGPRKAKEVMKDMGQGLKVLFTREPRSRDASPSRPRDVGANIRDGITGFSGGVVDNIRGAKDSFVNKPREIAHRVKNKFGSADNINSLKSLEDAQGSTDDNTDKHSYVGGGGTLPSGYHFPATSGQSEEGDEAISTVSSESHRSGGIHSGIHSNSVPPHPSTTSNDEVQRLEVSRIQHELTLHRQENERLSDEIAAIRSQLSQESEGMKQLLEEERYRMERVEEQVNDLTELHQHEVNNIKQELQSMEEKMEYQLEERTRDMQELLESCQTRITKMELQQQQQQLISMEGFDSSNFRNLITKLINVVLAILAVLLVLVSTIAQFLGPFLTTRVRILSTIFLVAIMVIVWQNWNHMSQAPHNFVDYITNLLPGR